MNRKKIDLPQTTTVIQGDSGSLQQDRQKAKYQDPCLIVIQGQFQGHRFFITQPELVLGRDGSADIVLDDPNISRKHLWLLREDGEVKLRDLGSANGTCVNNKKVQPKETVVLKKEDQIQLGATVLKFLPAGEIETVFYDHILEKAHLDALTQVYKRPYLMDALTVEFRKAKSLGTDLSLVFFIIDHFKLVNDGYGHDAGDMVLREFAKVIQNSGVLEPQDILARYGGEEFVLLLPKKSASQATELARKLRGAVESRAFIYEGQRIQVTSSYGIAELDLVTESAQSLLKRASQALDEPRKSQRNQMVVS